MSFQPDYTAYPYPYPMRNLAALLYTFGRELQHVAGRAVADVTTDWTALTADTFTGLYVLPVTSTLGFPLAGTLRLDGFRVAYEDRQAAAFLVAWTELPAWYTVRRGTRVMLEVST